MVPRGWRSWDVPRASILNKSTKHTSVVTFSVLVHRLRVFNSNKLVLTVCYYHVTYEFQSESTLYSLPECQETPCLKQAPYLKFMWQQRESNPQPLSSWMKTLPLPKLAKRLSCLVSIYLYCAFDCMLLSYHVRVSEWSLGAKWLWVPFPLLSHKLQILRLLWARSSLTFRQTTECRFTLKFVCDMMKKYIVKSTVQISTHNTAQSFGQSG